jgi:hypothetical protein
MLSVLLDEQISPVVAEQLAARQTELRVESVHRWRDGALLGADDDIVLRAASTERLTLVTYDLKTIPPLLTVWARLGDSHAGVVFVDERTIAPADFGGLIRALLVLWARERLADWTDRTQFLDAP